MALTREQRDVVARALRVARQKGASPRVQKALVEALGVESNYRHLPYGDRDSVGALQQRPSQGWGPAGESLETDVAQFLQRAMQTNRGFKGSAGQLAQAVQRSAFPGRYDQRGGEAEQLLAAFGGRTAGRSGGRSSSGASGSRTITETTPGVDRSKERFALLAQYLLSERGKPDALALLAQGINGAQDTPGTTTTRTVPSKPAGRGANGSNRSARQGKSPLFELFYDPLGGWKNGKAIGPIGNHSDHVHLAAGPKTTVQLAKLAQQMGLHVSENPAFDKVDPVHVQGSYHYRNRAADISGDPKKMAAFTKRVLAMYGIHP